MAIQPQEPSPSRKLFKLSDIYSDEPRTLSIGPVKIRWPFPVAFMMGGSSTRVFGRPVFSGARPFWLMPTYRAFQWVYDAKWRFRHRYIRKYQFNIIRTDLEPGYYDVDTLMLHGVMALVVRYVEEERGGEDDLDKWGNELIDPANNDPNAPEGLMERQGQKELDVLDIYRWWKHQRPADLARKDALLRVLYRRGRVSWEPTDHPKLSQMVFKEFEGDEIAMSKEMWALEEKIEQDEQKFLHLAIDLRGGMWT